MQNEVSADIQAHFVSPALLGELAAFIMSCARRNNRPSCDNDLRKHALQVSRLFSSTLLCWLCRQQQQQQKQQQQQQQQPELVLATSVPCCHPWPQKLLDLPSFESLNPRNPHPPRVQQRLNETATCPACRSPLSDSLKHCPTPYPLVDLGFLPETTAMVDQCKDKGHCNPQRQPPNQVCHYEVWFKMIHTAIRTDKRMQQKQNRCRRHACPKENTATAPDLATLRHP